jgi:hypothetical protein
MKLTRLGKDTTFMAYLNWREKVETGFNYGGINIRELAPSQFQEYGHILFSESLHQRLSRDGIYGSKDWERLLEHLRKEELPFSWQNLQGELRKIRQGPTESMRDFLRRYNAIREYASVGEMEAKTLLVRALTERAKNHLSSLLVARHATGIHQGDVADVLE